MQSVLMEIPDDVLAGDKQFRTHLKEIYQRQLKTKFLPRIVHYTGIDHFTVSCSVTWPLNGREAGGDLVLIQTSLLLLCKTSCSNANQVHLHDKRREVCIKARSPAASLPFKDQVTEQRTVKWSITR